MPIWKFFSPRILIYAGNMYGWKKCINILYYVLKVNSQQLVNGPVAPNSSYRQRTDVKGNC